MLPDPVVDEGMDEASGTFCHAADRHGVVEVGFEDPGLEYFPEFEVGPAEDVGLLGDAVVHGAVLLVVDDGLAVLDGGLGQTFVVPVDLYELADVEVLLDMGAPQGFDGSDLVLEVGQSAGLAAAGVALPFD